MNEMTIREFVARFNDGEFEDKSVSTQIDAGWFDWFCHSSSLAGKTKMLGKKVAKISCSQKFDQDNSYVFFKNCCPAIGPLYDRISICDLGSGDVLFCIEHIQKGSHGSKTTHWEVYGSEDGFHNPIVNGSWYDVQNYFNN